MKLGDGMRERLAELEKQFPDMTKRFRDIAEGATLRAVEKAVELTPPNTFEEGEVRGVNMISGEMAQHWRADSKTKPTMNGGEIRTVLANKVKDLENDIEYASYVDEGHRLDKRFVPGLYIDPETGLLSRDLERDVGLVVGTKTTYVEGLHIKDQAVAEYDEVVRAEFEKLTREMQG